MDALITPEDEARFAAVSAACRCLSPGTLEECNPEMFYVPSSTMRVRAMRINRSAQLAGATGLLTTADVAFHFATNDGLCTVCDAHPIEYLCPITPFVQGGSNTRVNYQGVCRRCRR